MRTWAAVTSETPTPSVVGTMQKMVRPVAKGPGMKGSARTAKPSSGVKPMMDARAKSVPGAARRVNASFSSSVRSVRPEMKKTMQMQANVEMCTPITWEGLGFKDWGVHVSEEPSQAWTRTCGATMVRPMLGHVSATTKATANASGRKLR